MSRTFRTFAASSLIALTVAAGGIAAAPAHASTANPARTTAAGQVRPAEIQGYYKTQSACNTAGAKGVRQGKWSTYVCYESDLVWVLDVQIIV